jgi:hypothetical protein
MPGSDAFTIVQKMVRDCLPVVRPQTFIFRLKSLHLLLHVVQLSGLKVDRRLQLVDALLTLLEFFGVLYARVPRTDPLVITRGIQCIDIPFQLCNSPVETADYRSRWRILGRLIKKFIVRLSTSQLSQQ